MQQPKPMQMLTQTRKVSYSVYTWTRKLYFGFRFLSHSRHILPRKNNIQYNMWSTIDVETQTEQQKFQIYVFINIHTWPKADWFTLAPNQLWKTKRI